MNLLGAPVRKRMRRHCGQPQVILPGEPHHVAPQLLDLGLGFFDVLAHRGPNLDYGLVHFRFHPLLQNHPALFQDFGVDVRPKIAGDRIDCLILLFNPDGESRTHRVWRGRPRPRNYPGPRMLTHRPTPAALLGDRTGTNQALTV